MSSSKVTIFFITSIIKVGLFPGLAGAFLVNEMVQGRLDAWTFETSSQLLRMKIWGPKFFLQVMVLNVFVSGPPPRIAVDAIWHQHEWINIQYTLMQLVLFSCQISIDVVKMTT